LSQPEPEASTPMEQLSPAPAQPWKADDESRPDEFHLAEPPEPLRARSHGILFGDDGLRAGWSFLLFVLLLAAISVGGSWLLVHLHLLHPPAKGQAVKALTPRGTVLMDGIGSIFLLLAAWVMSRVERRPFGRYGLNLRRAFPDFAAGAAWGIGAMSALIGTLYLTHSIAFDGFALHGLHALGYAVRWAVAFLCVGLFEEFLTRGFLQYTVSRGVAGMARALSQRNRHTHALGFAVAAFLFSVCLFMVGHVGNPGETVPGIIAVGLAGAVFAFSLWRTGTLWWAIGIHATWDWTQSFFYGVRDSGLPAQGHLIDSHPLGRALFSGGSTGPEGSIFVIPTLLLVAVVIHYTLPMRAYPLTPDQMPPPREGHPDGHPQMLPDRLG
jgi:membrane protease YdiL (CAAX protease family)